MVTLEKYYDDGDDAVNAITATYDGLDYTVGIMYDTESGNTFSVKIRGKENMKKFAAAMIDVLSGFIEDIDEGV